MNLDAPPRGRHRAGVGSGVEGNARLTAGNGAILLVLLAVEGFTVLSVRQMLTLHVFVGLVLVPPLLKVHKASFLAWFAVMTIHVAGHLGEVFRLAPRDWPGRRRREISGAGKRQWLIAATLVVGVVLGFALLSHVGAWRSAVSLSEG